MKTFKKNKYRILSTISKYSFAVILLFILILPTIIVSADPVVTKSDIRVENTAKSDIRVENTVKKIDTGIDNPLENSGIEDIPSFLVAIITIVLYIGVPIITLAIIYSGFLFVQAQGNAEKITKAKQAFIYTLIGAAILLGSFVITKAIQGTVGDINTAANQ